MFHNLNGIQLGHALGKNRKTVARWTKAGMPRHADKSYDLPAVVGWLLERERSAIADQVRNDPGSPELERWRRARAELAELELEQRRGDLIRLEAVLELWCRRYKLVRDALLYLVDRLPPVLIGLEQSEIRDQVQREIYGILTGFAQDGKFTPRKLAVSRHGEILVRSAKVAEDSNPSA